MLTVSGLSKRFGSGESSGFAMRDIGFAVAPGEFFTLLGPSGCGKTTTLRSIAGLETPDDGEIKLAGETVFSAPRRITVPVARRDIAMVFQSYAIWPHMTVFENVAFPLRAMRVHGTDIKRRVERALELVGLATLRDRPAPMLSGGQQQRVALARAIVKEAKVLLLDEPLSNLDAKLREQMRAELRELQQRIGTTAIYVTHDQDEALSLSNRIAVMNEGRIVELDTPTRLYLAPRTAFTARFVGHAELIACRPADRHADILTIETDFARLHSRSFPDRIENGASLLIRPEHIEIINGRTENGTNCIDGVVETAVFSGRLVEYTVRVGPRRLRVHATSRDIRATGEPIRLHLPPDRCVVLNDAPP